GCGYGYYRTSTRTTNKKIYYYRCLGSDDYRYEGGRVCANKPVRADYLDQVVWDHITGLLADPQLIQAEIDKRLHAARAADPTREDRQRVLRTVVKDILIDPEHITARHRIPVVHHAARRGPHAPDATDTEGDHPAGYWGAARFPDSSLLANFRRRSGGS